MGLLAKATDYTDKDFDSLRERLYKLLRSVFPEWTDQTVANFGNILVELFAHVGDITTFYQDNQGREARITTASQRRSLLGLCKLVGFVPQSAQAAAGPVSFSIPVAVAGSVTIAAGQEVDTGEATSPVKFELQADVVIPAGSTAVSGTVEHSEAQSDVFTSTVLGNQEYVLTRTPYLDASAEVSAANGAYTEVAHFLDSLPTDRHYTVAVDQNDRARVRFGNGTQGAIPGGTITLAYKTGGGAVGNVAAGAIKRITGAFSDAFGTPVIVSVTNPSQLVDGRERMTNAEIKTRAPASVRAPVNSIAQEDFEINARRLSQVARALMVTRNEDPAIPENQGHLYIVPDAGGTASPSLLVTVQTQVTVIYPCPLTFRVTARAAPYKVIDITAVVYRRHGYEKPTVRAAALAALTAFFAVKNADGSDNENVDFGAKYEDSAGVSTPAVPWSDVYNAVRDSSGVRKLDAGVAGFLLNGARADVALLAAEFPQLGTLTLIDGDDGLTF